MGVSILLFIFNDILWEGKLRSELLCPKEMALLHR